MSTTGWQRPPRLRNACLACTSAKVKCSGEKTGCSRCTNNASSCVYLESMAGRVPRAPKRQSWVPLPYEGVQHVASPQLEPGGAQSDSDSPSRLWYMDAGSAARPPSSTASSSTAVDSLPSIPPDDFLLPPAAWGFPGDQPVFQLLDLTCDMWPGINPTPPDDTTASAMFGASPWTDSESDLLRQMHKRCVLAATQIINVLENTIDSPAQPLDTVLEIVRKADVALNGLIGLQQQSRQERCLALLGAILDQILVLIETHVWRLEMDDGGGPGGGGSRSSSGRFPLPAHNAVLHQLDSINELISSHPGRADVARPEPDKVARARRLLVQLECCLRTASRAMDLAHSMRTDTANVGQESFARSSFDVTGAQLGLLRQRLYDVVVKMVLGSGGPPGGSW